MKGRGLFQMTTLLWVFCKSVYCLCRRGGSKLSLRPSPISVLCGLYEARHYKIKKLIENKQIGYIENITMSDGLKKIKIQPQNPHYEVFAEVEKLSFQLAGKLKTLK